jgi:hypothetical protein
LSDEYQAQIESKLNTYLEEYSAYEEQYKAW